MFRKTETDLAALAVTAGRYKTVTTPWLGKQLDALLADIRAENASAIAEPERRA